MIDTISDVLRYLFQKTKLSCSL